jgi:hypothetical protein
MKISIEDKEDQVKFIIEGSVPVSKRISKEAIIRVIAKKLAEFNKSMSEALIEITGPIIKYDPNFTFRPRRTSRKKEPTLPLSQPEQIQDEAAAAARKENTP